MDENRYQNKSVKRTHVALVLDASGSMQKVRNATVQGFNQEIAALRKAEHELNVTLVVFNNEVDVRLKNTDIEYVDDLSEDLYNPKGGTSLYDAIGYTIATLQEIQVNEDDTFLVKIFSDGDDRNSTEFTQQTIAALINEKQNTNQWTFTYLGCNHDLSVVQRRLGLPASNMSFYSGSNQGSQIAFLDSSNKTLNYLKKRQSGIGGACCSTKFYSDKEIIMDNTIKVTDTHKTSR